MSATTILRGLTGLVAGLVMAVAAASPAAASHPITLRPFAAVLSDSCGVTWTAGDLAWNAAHPPETPAVHISGEVGAHITCHYLVPVVQFAAFTAYIDNEVVDLQVVSADGANPTDFTLTLQDNSPGWQNGDSIVPAVIERVEIRACRTTDPRVFGQPPVEEWDEVPPELCGAPDTHDR